MTVLCLSDIVFEQMIPPGKIEAEIGIVFFRIDRVMDPRHVRWNDDPAQYSIKIFANGRIGISFNQTFKYLFECMVENVLCQVNILVRIRLALNYLSAYSKYPSNNRLNLNSMERKVSGRSPKMELFDQLATVAKALGHSVRLELIEYMGQGERSVEALAQLAGHSVANTSHHLLTLRRAGLAQARKDGKHVLYRLSGDDVIDLVGSLRVSAERHNTEVERVLSGYFRSRDDMEALSREELLRRAKDGLVTILDVRPSDEFEAGHLPHAVNVELGELDKRLKELPIDREVIAYCRGAYCVLSFEAVAQLREKGFKARRLEEGYPEWKAAGLPVDITS